MYKTLKNKTKAMHVSYLEFLMVFVFRIPPCA